LRFFFILVMMPGTNGRVDEASEEEEKTDKQYDTDHATVKSMSFSHTGSLTHKRFLQMYPTVWAILTLRHTVREWSIHHYVKCKNASVVLSFYVMEHNFIICINNELTKIKKKKSNK